MNKTHNRSETTPSETSTVELTRYEGLRLLTFLEERIKCSDAKDRDKTLSQVLARLCDADTIALWLRENVVVKLTREEVADISKLLEAGPSEPPKKTSSPLTSVARKLNELF